MKGTPTERFNAGFSLVEMLVVMGIIGVLAVLAAPAFQSLAGTKGPSNAMNVIQGVLDHARNEAQTRQTYVWVGFKNVVNSSSNSEAVVTLGYSSDGTTNATSPVYPFKIERFDNVQLLNIASTNTNAVNVMSSTSWPTLTRTSSSTNITFNNVLTFTPAGQVLYTSSAPTSTTPYVPVAGIIVGGTRGTTTNGDIGEIYVFGATGTVKRGTLIRR